MDKCFALGIFSSGHFRYQFGRSGTGFLNNTLSVTRSLDRPNWWLPFSVPVCFCSFLLPLFFSLARSRCLLNYSDLRFKRAQESVRPTPIWCIWKGEPVSWAGPPPSTRRVGSGKLYASPDRLCFRDPSFFIPGSIHHSLPMWSEILHDSPNRSTFLRYLEYGVDVKGFPLSLRVLFMVKFMAALYPGLY